MGCQGFFEFPWESRRSSMARTTHPCLKMCHVDESIGRVQGRVHGPRDASYRGNFRLLYLGFQKVSEAGAGLNRFRMIG